MKIFGIGLNKTGTTTLGGCFKILGFSHQSGSSSLLQDLVLNKNYDNIFTTIKANDSFEDLPWNLIYKYLDKKFPNSKFILTLRKDKKTWLTSFKNHCNRGAGMPLNRKLAFGYDEVDGNENEFLKIYEKHNKDVKDYFKNKPNQLLTICWERGDGWRELCDFLDKPIPDHPLPCLNQNNET
jgi:hypothetical protein